MKIGIIPVNVGVKSVDHIVGFAQLAEAQGLESVWTFEHVMVPEDYSSKYPYSADGKMGAGPDTNFVDPLIALATVAAHTKTLKLGTGVNIVAQSNPLYLAKQAASLDFVSGGRFLLGAGIGWLREEFDAMGVPFERRGARFDDYIVAMRKVWKGDVVNHKSDFINWSGFRSYPIPASGTIPIIMGGNKGKIYERIATLGDGWYIPADTPEAAAALLEPLAAACEAVDRDPASVEITSMWNGQGGLETVDQFRTAGVHRLVVPVYAFGADPVEGLMSLAENVVSKL